MSPQDPPDPKKLLAAKYTAISALWYRGQLLYKLHATQERIYRSIKTSEQKEYYLLCSRRLGKSFLLFCLAIETALQKPNARIVYLAPWAKDAANIAMDLAIQILEDCPSELRPKFTAQPTKEFVFPTTKSTIRFQGVNGEHAQFLRGGAADLVILDEAGLMDNLTSVINDVCAPMVLTTKGRILIATTPPLSPGHDSVTIYERLAGLNATCKFTLRDAPHIPENDKLAELVRIGEDPARVRAILAGDLEPETTTARREFFCEFVTDASKAVVPEFNKAKRQVVKLDERPEYFDAYTAIDPGFEDRTGIVYGYLDFLKDTLVIEDEDLLHRANTLQIAQAIKEKETALWGLRTPYLRVSDIDKRLIADLYDLHRLKFRDAEKQDSLGAINLLRNLVQTHRIHINPKCVSLIRQLENAIWNNRATDFARPGSGEVSIDGHFDLVAALKYLVRSVNWRHNPYPDNYYLPGGKLGPPAGAYISRKNRKKATQFQLETPTLERIKSARK